VTNRDQRPKNLNLFTIRMPLPAIVSILHRISGILLFLLIPIMIWGLNLSLKSSQDFDNVHQFLTTPILKFIIWFCLAGFLYHLVAGIRHLLMDINIGIELKSGRLSALLTLIVAASLIILTGIWLW
jgi:succinate dehydrogenase / fumarate reductase, cytochrome b subunit